MEDKTFTQKIWADRQLDPVEGIWAIKSNWSTQQIVITRNTTEVEKESEYLGIILQKSGNNLWVNGDICLLIKKSINPTYFNATWLIPNLFGTQRLPSSVVLSTAGDAFESSIPGPFGQVNKYNGTKLYPSEGQGVPNFKNATGTGFFVTPTLVVTNAHIVEGATQITVEFQGEMTMEARKIAVDKSNDLAVLKVDGLASFVKPLTVVSSRNTAIGDRVYTAGFPTPAVLGRSMKFSDGIVNSLNGLEDDPRAFQISINIAPGLSGGPLLNGRGQVVGLVSHNLSLKRFFYKTQTIPAASNFAIKSGNILAMLNDLAGAEEISAGTQSTPVLDISQIAEVARKAIVLIEVK